MKKKRPEMKVTYHYVEPKTEEERKDQERRLHQTFSMLCELTLESEGWKQYVANRKKS